MKKAEEWAEAMDWPPEKVMEVIREEYRRGVEKFGEYNSMHEAYAVIKEELDEFWEGVKKDDPDPMELIQVCATAYRAFVELVGYGKLRKEHNKMMRGSER